MIHEHEVVPLLVNCIPEFRTRLVESIDNWMNDDGTISTYGQLGELTRLVVDRFDAGNYDGATELFLLVERLFEDGSESVRNAIATGFLENMQNQTTLSGEYWAPLIGERAKAFCKGMDGFYGAKTRGLYDVDIDP